ncbi:unnamed protein product [Hermetia illucens]|uniref:guanylate cyclase n=1 Tax=Hermetia illucens TaxID=343691 RepID=A0A7R8V398_HERIL|nr:unnamed protein product [Hermetia illucens]
MYGFVNYALELLVLKNFGLSVWEQIKKKAEIAMEGQFLVRQIYDDEITYNLIGAAVEILNIPADSILELFGKTFFEFCQDSGFDKILQVLGATPRDFLQNLDALHDHLGTLYPGMRAPSFRCTEKDGSLILHYYSERPGLEHIVIGIVKAVASKLHGVEVNIEIIKRKGEPLDDDEVERSQQIASSSSDMNLSNAVDGDGLRETNNNDEGQQKNSQTSCANRTTDKNPSSDSNFEGIKNDGNSDNEFSSRRPSHPSIHLHESFDESKANECLRLWKNKSDDIERSDHVQFLITETLGASRTAQTNVEEKEPPDEVDFFCEGSLISPSTFSKIFPFHLMFDRNMKIVQAGKSVSRVIPRVSDSDCPLLEVLEAIRPHLQLTFENILAHINTIYVLQTRPGAMEKQERYLRLKGQMLYIVESDLILFQCYPSVMNLNDLTETITVSHPDINYNFEKQIVSLKSLQIQISLNP